MAQFAIDEVLTTGIQISGFIFDYSSSLGTPGQVLASTSSGVMWQADSSIPDLSSLSGLIAATGTLLNNRINSLSGYSDATFATITNLAATGSTLDTKINTLSGYSNANFATILNLAATGSTLNARINSLSGYAGSTFLSGQGVANWTARWNGTKELITGSIYDLGTGVGIGTTSPAAKFNVYGGNTVFRNDVVGGTSAVLIRNWAASPSTSLIFGNNTDDDSSTTLDLTANVFSITNYGDPGSFIKFGTRNDSTADIRVTIDPSGKVGIGALNLSSLLTVGGAGSVNSFSGITFGEDSSANLYRSAASTIKTDGSLEVAVKIISPTITSLSGNLATTGSTLDTKINTLSGYSNSTFATILNLATTGSTLDTKINTLSGYSNANFATILNLAATGSTLDTKINTLSGYAGNTFLSGVGVANYIPRWNTSKQLVTGNIYDNGNVGIGTASPNTKLRVNGSFSHRPSGSSNIQEYKNIVTYNLDTNGNGGYVVKTPFLIGSSYEMAIVHVKGYGYGSSSLYDFKVVFYDYGPSNEPISYSLIDLGNDGLPKYLAKDANNYVQVCFGNTTDVNNYYYRFTVDCITTRNDSDYSQGWGMHQTTGTNFGFASTGVYPLSSPINFNVATNYVGIGKTNPACQLDVVGTIRSSTNQIYGFGANDSVSLRANSSVNVLGIYTSNVERLRVDANGYLGIGLAPSTLLSVGGAGSTSAASGLTFGGDASANLYRISSSRIKTDGFLTIDGGGGGATNLLLNRSSSSNENGMAFTTAGSVDWYYYVDNGNNNLQIQRAGENDTTPRVRFDGSNSNILFNLGGGNVGIGTSIPQGRLHVSGASDFVLFLKQGVTGSQGGVYLENADGYAISSARLHFISGDSVLFTRGPTNLAWSVSQNANVGIGVSNPSEKLTITGAVKILTRGGDNFKVGDGSNNNTFLEFDYPDISTADANFRLFRNTNTNGGKYFRIFKGDGTATSQTLLNANGDSHINAVAGNLGIGTDSPTQKLQVSGTVKIQSLGVYSDPTDNAAFLNYDTNGGIFTLSARSDGGNTYMAFRTSNGGTGNEKVRITNDGRVGISSNAPTDFLDFGGAGKNIVFDYASYGEALNSAASIIGNNVKASPTGNSQVRRFANATDQGNFIRLIYNKGVTFHTNITSVLNTDISEDTNERMRINLSGNVIIGNTTAYAGLTISDVAANDGNDSLAFFYRGTAGAHESLIRFYDFRGQNNASIGNNLQDDGVGIQKADLVFKTAYNSSPIERMRIDNLGNVGIGTTSPAYRLDVLNSGVETVAQFRGVNDTTIIIGGNDVGRIGEQYITYQNSETATLAWMVGMDDGEDFRFAYGVAGEIDDDKTKVKIGQDGKVGIGTVSPTTLLSVGGADSTLPASGLTFGGDAQVNLYRSAENILKTDGSLIITDSLGLGLSPTQKLQVDGVVGNPALNGTTQSGIFRISNTTDNATLDIGIRAAGSGAWLQSTDETSLSAYYSLLLNPNGGNVGIGTTSPLKLLHVHGTNGEVVRLSMASSYTAGYGPQLSFWNAAQEELASIRGAFNETSQGNRANLIFGTRTSDALGVETKMTILHNGKVGIGTASPTTLLSVGGVGSASAASGITFGGDSVVNLYRLSDSVLKTDAAFTAASLSSSSYVYASTYLQTAGGQLYAGAPYGTLTVYVGNTAQNAWEAGLYVGRGSYVGIGTTQPSGKLHVVSTVAGETVLRADGTNGTLFSVVDDLSDSLMSVNNSAGLPVLEVFADDRVVAGQYGSGDFVLVNNKVGIGTSNPVNKLSVIGAASIGSSTYNTSAPSNGLIVEGSVGIGTANPSYKLDVSASVIDVGRFYNNQTALILNVGSTNNTEYTDLQLITSNGNAQFFKQRSSASWGGTDSLNIYTSNGGIAFHPSGTQNAVYFANNGNVGIGITNPSFKLHTAGAGFIGRQNSYGTYDAADADLIISNYNSDNTSILLFNSAGAYNSSLINYYNNILSLGLNNDNSSNLILTSTSINITAAGVGIGTSVITGLLNVTRNSNTAQPIAFFKELYGSPAATNILLLERGNNLSAADQTSSNAGLRIRDHSSDYSLSIEDHNSNVNFAISGSKVLVGSRGTNSLLNVGGAGSVAAASGLTFGEDASANLYRSAASTIKTDGNLVVAGTTSLNGHVYGKKTVSLTTASYTTVLTVNLTAHTSCYVKIGAFGDWTNHSAIAFVSELFIQNGDNAGFAEPGTIITAHDNTAGTAGDKIDIQIVDPAAPGTQNFLIQLKLISASSSTNSSIITYHVMGQQASVT